MALKQDLNYQNSALYKFLHKHRERIFKDRTKTPENTALFLLYLGFSLKEALLLKSMELNQEATI